MGIFSYLAIGLAAVLIVIGAAYMWFGGLHKIQFVVVETGGEILVYQRVVGDYKNSGKAMDQVYSALLSDFDIPTTRGFGIYHDNPKTVDAAQLRADVGVILPVEYKDRIAELSQKFSVSEAAFGRKIETVFPYRGQMSIMIGVLRVYPALEQYIQEQGLPAEGLMMEIYDLANGKITYHKEVSP